MDTNRYTNKLISLLTDLCMIPAPSLKEDERAEFCRAYFQDAGFPNTFCDDAKNVIAPWNLTEDNEIVIFSAHTDTVFPEETPLTVRRENGKIYCPGIGDGTANLAILMLSAKILNERKKIPNTGILFVANAGEEGLGNLKGSKTIAQRYGDRIKAWISFDLSRNDLFVKAVGSERYRISITTEGGHSYENFRNQSAISILSEIITELYKQPLPQKTGTKTTFNVGVISGGTTINTIAQQAEMLYEYRSDDDELLEIMKTQMTDILEDRIKNGTDLTVTCVGKRPGMGICKNPELQRELIKTAEETIRDMYGTFPKRRSGSTDCNIPFSMGIPAVCFGLAESGGAHTTEEWVEEASLQNGLKTFLHFIERFFSL